LFCEGWCRLSESIKRAYIPLAVLASAFTCGIAAAAGQTASAPIQTTEQSSAIHGVVLNASTGQPVGRALVQVQGQSLLTGYDGKFEFTGLNGATAEVAVRKPGFYEGPSLSAPATKAVAVGTTDEVQVKLYPEALITGTVSAANGDPLSGVQVQVLGRTDDGLGPRWRMQGETSTNGDGQFRLPVPGGEYVVETMYRAARPGARGAVLPVMVPAAGSNGGTGGTSTGVSTLRLVSGTEQHLELHPPVRPSHTVHVQIDSAGGADAGQFAPQIEAHLANGLVFSPSQSRSERQGEVAVSLPNGSYLLSASTGMRDDAASYGETRVTVADEDVAGVTIHLQKALELPVEVAIDPASGSAAAGSTAVTETGPDPGSASFVQQLGIFLERMDPGVNLRSENVSPASRRSGQLGFSLLPGVYRLRSQGYSQWYVESATAGGTDLLTQNLAVDGGSSPVPLRLVVNNQMAPVKGTAKLGGQAAESYVSLVATTPSTIPMISTRSAADGSFSRNIPPGTYQALASETRLNMNLSDPAVQKQLAPYMKAVTVAAGETESIDLDAMPASEMKP
jgi:hypothetical protein